MRKDKIKNPGEIAEKIIFNRLQRKYSKIYFSHYIKSVLEK
jgi:hypothetical protein